MKITIVRESDLKRKGDDWKHLIKESKIIWESSVVILLKNDGTYQPVKNRHGSSELVGTFGSPLDLTIM